LETFGQAISQKMTIACNKNSIATTANFSSAIARKQAEKNRHDDNRMKGKSKAAMPAAAKQTRAKRTDTKAAATKERTVNMKQCIHAGFELCKDAMFSNDTEKMKLWGTFYRWLEVETKELQVGIGLYDGSNASNNPSEERVSTINKSEKKYMLQINTKFAKSVIGRRYNEHLDLDDAVNETRKDMTKQTGNWKDWVYVAPTTRQGIVTNNTVEASNNRGRRIEYGLFAARKFRKGDVIGVFMGSSTGSGTVENSNDNEYRIELRVERMKVIVDAKGGVNSGACPWLGMHFMNDPTDMADRGPEKTRKLKEMKWNIEVNPEGVAIATQTIDIDKELLLNYQRFEKI
jgi:hypothetical protein